MITPLIEAPWDRFPLPGQSDLSDEEGPCGPTELLPGFRFNTHSAAHKIINATGIVEELELAAVA
ncbi:MAG TPA: hypothetical protein VGP04_01675 [Pseudonocardiaceae bacterium]|jgi:hypothetical protein|nr:hypothetical protein [Pseudonocardiaceae bacterium]